MPAQVAVVPTTQGPSQTKPGEAAFDIAISSVEVFTQVISPPLLAVRVGIITSEMTVTILFPIQPLVAEVAVMV